MPVANAVGLLVAPYVRLALPRTSLPKSVVSRIPVTPNYYVIFLQLTLLAYFVCSPDQQVLESDAGNKSTGKGPSRGF